MKEYYSYIGSGVVKLYSDDSKGAVNDLNRAIAKNSGSAIAYHLRANARSKMGDTSGGIQDRSIAIGLDPHYRDFYNDMGNRLADIDREEVKNISKSVEKQLNTVITKLDTINSYHIGFLTPRFNGLDRTVNEIDQKVSKMYEVVVAVSNKIHASDTSVLSANGGCGECDGVQQNRRSMTIETSQRRPSPKIPPLEINLGTGIIKIASTMIDLSPVEFSHYCVLAKNAKDGSAPFYFQEEDIPREMVEDADSYYERTFPQKLELFTQQELIKRKARRVAVKTWRSYMSNINKAFRESSLDPAIIEHYKVTIEGKRHSSLYSIKANSEKIRFISQ